MSCVSETIRKGVGPAVKGLWVMELDKIDKRAEWQSFTVAAGATAQGGFSRLTHVFPTLVAMPVRAEDALPSVALIPCSDATKVGYVGCMPGWGMATLSLCLSAIDGSVTGNDGHLIHQLAVSRLNLQASRLEGCEKKKGTFAMAQYRATGISSLHSVPRRQNQHDAKASDCRLRAAFPA